MEWFCGTRIPALKKFFPVVLKQLYEEELVEEEVRIQIHTYIHT
jgi:hypothetical protein